MTDTQYVCTAPLIDVIVGADANGEGGSLQRIHKGGGLPLKGLYQRQVDHLLDREMIAKAGIIGGLESVVADAVLNPPASAEPAKTAAKRTS